MHRTERLRQQSGVVLLTVLIFILVSSLVGSSLVQIYQTQTRREREEQLLFVGDQYRRAIASYYNTIAPGGARSFPRTLDELISDNRFAKPLHHLRQLYPDPMTGRADWDLVVDRGGISGVRSQSTLAPMKRQGFPLRYRQFEDQNSYSSWIFAVGLQQ